MIKKAGLAIAIIFASASSGMLVGNAAMWGTSFAATGKGPQPLEVSSPPDRVAAAFGSMFGAGFAGFAIGACRRRQQCSPG
jgi:hypothetical protein